MPAFSDFEYFFAVDILMISKFAINITTIFGAVLIFLLPILYQKYLSEKEYLISFYISQITYVISMFLGLAMALRLNKHIPSIILYVICGPIAAVLEKNHDSNALKHDHVQGDTSRS